MIRSQTLILLAMCFVLVLVRGLGMHAHVSHEPDHPDAPAGHIHGTPFGPANERVAVVVHPYDAGHFASEPSHGVMDIDSPAKTVSKLPTWKLLAVFVGLCWFVCVLLSPARAQLATGLDPPPRPLRRTCLLPPSQAPPCAA